MTAPAAAVSHDALDTAIAAATGQPGKDAHRLAVAVFRLLRLPAAGVGPGHGPPPAWTPRPAASRWQPPCSAYSRWQMHQRPARARCRTDKGRNDHAV